MFKYIITFALIASISNAVVGNNVNYEEYTKTVFDFDVELENENDTEINYFYTRQRIALIFPGTKWCGAGNTADNYDDLGPSKDTDMCCRAHDNCPEVIAAGETKYNLTNEAFYSRLSCDCDETFRKCLRKVNSKTSRTVGTMYFNAIGTMCYKKDYPITGCKRNGGWFNRKCVEYEFDTTEERRYQWFDLPNF